MARMTSALAAALLTCAIGAYAQPAAPQGPGQSMLVLDASGSMWARSVASPRSKSLVRPWRACCKAGPPASNWG